MHESDRTINNDGVTGSRAFRSFGRLPERMCIPGGIEIGEHKNGFQLGIAPSMDARTHTILEQELFAFDLEDREVAMQEYAENFPKAIFIPDQGAYLLTSNSPKLALVSSIPPVYDMEQITKDDPGVISCQKDFSGKSTLPFFEYFILQGETSFLQEGTKVMALVSVGMRFVSTDFDFINEEIKRLWKENGISDGSVRKFLDPYIQVRLRPIPHGNNPDQGGEPIQTRRPTPPKYPDGQYAHAEEDIV